jgi:NAD(P)H-hydrate epimerase
MDQPLPPAEIVTQLTSLPARSPTDNKGDFGKILIVAGSRGMSGAAILCGRAALRGGAGLVRCAVPAEILPIVAGGDPCYLTVPLIPDGEGRVAEEAVAPLLAAAKGQDVLAVGPGMGRSAGVTAVVFALLESTSLPMVLDADGLNALSGQTQQIASRQAPLIITPHPGEFARLLGTTVAEVQANRSALARQFAWEHRVIVVLKGHGTVVTDGLRLYINKTGNPGMATGGTGDVLTGLIAALLGQGMEPFTAAQLGVHLHGLAGDLARERLGEPSLIATDLLKYLPGAFQQSDFSLSDTPF